MREFCLQTAHQRSFYYDIPHHKIANQTTIKERIAMKKVIITVSLITTVLVTTIAAIAAEVASKPAVIGVLFYADQCGSCKILDPKIQAVKKEFTDKPILFTRVDLTDDYTKSQSQMLASMLGISEIYNENAPKTGYMLLINAKDKKVLGKLTKTQSEE